MRTATRQSTSGKHRKITASPTAKGRIALASVAAGTIFSAGAGGAAAATLQTPDEAPASSESTAGDIALATSNTALSSSSADLVPQILAIAEYKPVDNVEEQLIKAVEYNNERVEAERAARAPSVVKPTEGTFTSGYGVRWGSVHKGLDIANAIGTPIVAAMSGTVIDSGPASGFGQWIRVQHNDGSIAVYGHMETLDVSVGEQVTAGQKIAGMGNRGFSTGSHLHFELYPAGSDAIDPAPWFAEHGITF